jgi:hypothetical protein
MNPSSAVSSGGPVVAPVVAPLAGRCVAAGVATSGGVGGWACATTHVAEAANNHARGEINGGSI